MKQMTIDGNEAVARTAYLFTEVAGIYPITPSSPMAEHIDEWSSKGMLNIFNDKVVGFGVIGRSKLFHNRSFGKRHIIFVST